MEVSQYALMLLHVYALILGACLGLVYDGFRITRIFLGAHYSRRIAKQLQDLRLPFLSHKEKNRDSGILGVAVFLEDLLFCVLTGLSLVILFYEMNNGKFRFLVLLCVGAGFLVYRFTLGRLIMYCSEWIAFAIATGARYLVFFLLLPFRLLWNAILRCTKRVHAHLKRARQKKNQRHYTAKQRARIDRDACGMIPIEQKKGNQYGKGKQKAIQPKSAYSHSSGRHGRGVDRHLCK
ncbi:MAG: spore cortex biosynthesis protein YabQ [Clostridia bacterium]|nr:spore cortex biosynthesis protein YabQ [Clostridia bacterium]MBQ5834189.1 spore cortex biosynthesis protein YabQ [Clostridia bacterium]